MTPLLNRPIFLRSTAAVFMIASLVVNASLATACGIPDPFKTNQLSANLSVLAGQALSPELYGSQFPRYQNSLGRCRLIAAAALLSASGATAQNNFTDPVQAVTLNRAMDDFRRWDKTFKPGVLEKIGEPAIPGLMQIARNPHEHYFWRGKAIEIISRMKPAPVESVRELSRDSDSDVRRLTIEAANNMGRESEGLLHDRLNDKSEDDYLRYLAAVSLVEQGDSSARIPAMKMIFGRALAAGETERFIHMSAHQFVDHLLQEGIHQGHGSFQLIRATQEWGVSNVRRLSLSLLQRVVSDHISSVDDKRLVLYAVYADNDPNGALDNIVALEDAAWNGYRVIYTTARNNAEALARLTDEPYAGLARILLITVHGSRTNLFFEDDSFAGLTASHIKKFVKKHPTTVLAPGGNVVLFSCDTGQKASVSWLAGESIVEAFREIFPQAESIWAPKNDANNIKISFRGPFSVIYDHLDGFGSSTFLLPLEKDTIDGTIPPVKSDAPRSPAIEIFPQDGSAVGQGSSLSEIPMIKLMPPSPTHLDLIVKAIKYLPSLKKNRSPDDLLLLSSVYKRCVKLMQTASGFGVFDKMVRSDEDYLLAFAQPNRIGISVEVLDAIGENIPLLAEVLFHEGHASFKKEQDKQDHKDRYEGVQRRLFGQENKLKFILRSLILDGRYSRYGDNPALQKLKAQIRFHLRDSNDPLPWFEEYWDQEVKGLRWAGDERRKMFFEAVFVQGRSRQDTIKLFSLTTSYLSNLETDLLFTLGRAGLGYYTNRRSIEKNITLADQKIETLWLHPSSVEQLNLVGIKTVGRLLEAIQSKIPPFISRKGSKKDSVSAEWNEILKYVLPMALYLPQGRTDLDQAA